MKRSLILITFVFAILLIISSSNAGVYKWVDEKGKVWITDYPNPKTQKQDRAKHDAQPANTQPTAVSELAATKTENTESVKQHDEIKSRPFSMPSLPRDFQKGMPADESAIFAMMAMMSGIMLFLWIAIYIYSSICLYFIAKKTDVPNPWLAFIPLANLWVMVTAAGKDWWWILLMLVPLVNIGVIIYIWMCITENVGKDKWLGLLMIVPIVQLVWMGILAFSKQESSADLIESQA